MLSCGILCVSVHSDHYEQRLVEIGTAAIECRYHRGLHLITDSVFVEIEPLPDNSLGNVGRIIVTDLRNETFFARITVKMNGKAVEIQALWYNALKTMQLLAKRFNYSDKAETYLGMAEKAKEAVPDTHGIDQNRAS